MINFFPALYEDELLYSQLTRCYVQSGCSCYQHISEELFTSKNSKPSILLINKYNEYGKQLITKNISLDDILFKHTMFPFYTRFYPLNQRNNIYDYFTKMDNNKGKNIIRHNSIYDLKYLRYCPICAKEDRKKYGETFWHRIHQLQGVKICIKHNCYLTNSKIPIDYNMSMYHSTAEEIIPIENRITMCNNEIEIKFAKYVGEVFLSEMDMKSNMTTSYLFYHTLFDTKYYNPNNRFKRLDLLQADITEYYSSLKYIQISPSFIERVFSRSNYSLVHICVMGLFLKIPPNVIAHTDIQNPFKNTWRDKRERNI